MSKDPATAANGPPKFQTDSTSPFRALTHYNFRVFWCGQLVSLIGNWMQGLAQGWLILVLADPVSRVQVLAAGGDAVAASRAHVSMHAQSAANFYSGMVNFAGGMPVLLLTLFAGVIIDRINKRRLLLATQAIQMCCALSLGILIKAGVVQIYHVLLVASVLGFAMAFDMPSRQSFVVELVGRKDLPSAVALNSSLFNAARSIGPAIAGLLLAAHVSLADCFLLNGFSYISVIIGLLLMRGKGLGDPKPAAMAEEQKMIENLKAGLDYVWNSHTVRNIVLLIGSFGTFAFSFNVLIPTFVRYTLLVNATNAEQVRAFGYLETWRGVGALCGAMSVVLFTSPERQKTMLMIGSLLATVLLIPFGLCHNITVAYVIMAVVSYAFVMCFSNANTLLQLTVPDHLRGRAMSIYMLMFVGTGPIGSLIAGYMAKYVGAPATIVTFAIISFVSALVICFRPGGIKDLVPPHLHARPVEVSAGK